MSGPVRYTSPDEDSARWDGFCFRPGDVVISARSKSGTTWAQMICALLVFGTPDLPAPLAELSPWLDHLATPRERVLARLEAQTHRRIIKTHTPLDGVPLQPDVHYLVPARHPLDLAVSLYHQGENLDRERMRQLTGAAPPAARPPLRAWLAEWVASPASPTEQMDSLPGVMWHLSDAWARPEPNVTLVHYDDLCQDLEAQMRRLSTWLGLPVPEAAWPDLVRAAGFASMRRHAEELVPDRSGIIKDPAAFFRRGGSGAGGEVLSHAELRHYHQRAAELAPPELLTWLHR